ncbi:hypothetical protein BGX31_003130, partial [Mortierella sp. GBA43]
MPQFLPPPFTQTLSQSLAMDTVHPLQMDPIMPAGPFGPVMHPDTTNHAPPPVMAQAVQPFARSLWLDNNGGLSHRASFHSLLSAGREERLRARQDRGSIVSIASTVGDDSPSEFNPLDLEPTLSDFQSQQGSNNLNGYEGDEHDHHGIGTGLAMMSFVEFMPQSHSSPGNTSAEGDLSSAQPSRSNSVMLDPSTVMKANSIFEMGEEPLHMPERFNGIPVQSAHPLSKEPLQPQQQHQLQQQVQQQHQQHQQHQQQQHQQHQHGSSTAAPVHPNETEGMLPMWSSMEMLSTPIHPFSMPSYVNEHHPLSGPADPTLLDSTNVNERDALTQQAMGVYEQDTTRSTFQPTMSTYANSPMYFTNAESPSALAGHTSMPGTMTDA